MNDITGETPASFEPTIDYVVTKVPRWAFEKLPGASPVLGTHDAVGRRGDGDRAHVPRVAAEGAALARDRPRRASTADPGRARVRRALGDDELVRRSRSAHARAAVPARGRAAPRRVGRAAPRGHRHRPVVPRPDARRSSRTRGVARGASASTTLDARATGGGPSGSASPTRSSRTCGASTRPRCSRRAARRRRRRHLQDGRHLRGGVRGAHAVPLRHLRGRGRGRAARRGPRS